MPNWVYNHLDIAGTTVDVDSVKALLNTPFTRIHENYNMETKQMESKEYTFSKPVFSFWNIIKPEDLETYQLQKDPNVEEMSFAGNNWYDWNVRNWGTKWDVAVSDEEKYPETELVEEDEDCLSYRFNTAWSPPLPAIAHLSTLYPNMTFSLSYEEETGWGGEILFVEGNGAEIESYDNKCRDCDALNTMEYCENDCGEICYECKYLGEADMEAVAECEVHKCLI